MTVAKFTQIDFLLVQELLGEYIRFDRIAKGCFVDFIAKPCAITIPQIF